MSRLIDLTGRRFGRLVVIRRAENTSYGRVSWFCRCDCGGYATVTGHNLKSGRTQSCGCLNKERIKEGLERIPFYGLATQRLGKIYKGMIDRTTRPNSLYYHRYGGRGIKVCDEWKNDRNAFFSWALSNGYADDLSIDRIDNDGDYSPSNCRWATRTVQGNNTSTNSRLSFKGQTHTVAEWALITGMSRNALYKRIRAGWPVDRILSEPVHKK